MFIVILLNDGKLLKGIFNGFGLTLLVYSYYVSFTRVKRLSLYTSNDVVYIFCDWRTHFQSSKTWIVKRFFRSQILNLSIYFYHFVSVYNVGCVRINKLFIISWIFSKFLPTVFFLLVKHVPVCVFVIIREYGCYRSYILFYS